MQIRAIGGRVVLTRAGTSLDGTPREGTISLDIDEIYDFVEKSTDRTITANAREAIAEAKQQMTTAHRELIRAKEMELEKLKSWGVG